MSKVSARNATRIIKRYLSARKRPVISPELGMFFDFVISRGQETVDRVRQLLLSLPPKNQAILHMTLGLLNKLSGLGANPEALAKIFGSVIGN